MTGGWGVYIEAVSIEAMTVPTHFIRSLSFAYAYDMYICPCVCVLCKIIIIITSKQTNNHSFIQSREILS